MSLTTERLREALSYDPDTGVWTWLLPTGRRVRVGSRAARIDCHGRWRIGLDGRYFTGSRLAFLYMTGKWPLHLVDHIDRDSGHAAALARK
jgi:hypothetical protein